MGGHKHVSERCFGDSDKCDRDYPRAVGIRGGVLLNRNGGKDFTNL